LLEQLKDAFYSLKFDHFERLCESLEKLHLSGSAQWEFLHLKASYYFETNDMDRAKDCLLKAKDSSQPKDCRYASARLAYMCGEYDLASQIFNSCLDLDLSPEEKCKVQLGLANISKNKNDFAAVKEFISSMKQEVGELSLDIRICILHLEGYLLAHDGSYSEGKRRFLQSLGLANQHQWNYWIVRSFYGLASLAKDQKAVGEMEWTLSVLKSLLENTKAEFLKAMVKEQFSLLVNLYSPVKFDDENMKLFIKDQWITFDDSPKIFKFLELLYFQGDYVEKTEIATSLWPAEDYKPRTHDPRIFDIARRVRKIIQDKASDALCLRSGRQGYKLACV
jgi:tetratricopeptide (TPR) repeat protein